MQNTAAKQNNSQHQLNLLPKKMEMYHIEEMIHHQFQNLIDASLFLTLKIPRKRERKREKITIAQWEIWTVQKNGMFLKLR